MWKIMYNFTVSNQDVMELYEYARPDLMNGKKILYCHGFASSGQSGTVKTLKLLLPKAEIIAPDIPVEPSEAMFLLRQICKNEKPDLIIGTSMGGMYAELMNGFDRILVNPAFQLADTILKNNGLGRQEWHNPRKNGESSFLVTKGLLEKFRECSSHCFENCVEDKYRVYGLFGIHDELVHTLDLFESYYPYAIRFDGPHSLNDSTVLHALLPIVQMIDDKQESTFRDTIFFNLDNTLVDNKYNKLSQETEPAQGAVKAFCKLSETYNCFILASPRYNDPEEWAEVLKWTERHFGVPAWNRVIMSNRQDVLMGDYLIDRNPERPNEIFAGGRIEFGSELYRSWEDVLTYFQRLKGQ